MAKVMSLKGNVNELKKLPIFNILVAFFLIMMKGYSALKAVAASFLDAIRAGI